MGLAESEAPFSEPYALAGNPSGFRSKGPTALAVKRALAHLGFLEWEPERWDEHWNEKVNDASAAWKRKRGIIPSGSSDGSWGKKAHDVMRSAWYEKSGDHLPAFDGESQRLLREEKAASSSAGGGDGSAVDRVRAKITEFCERAIGEPDWAYSQNRAVDVSVNPDGGNTSDCSGSVIQAFHFAKRETGLDVPDPAKQGWSGYGNTDYFQTDHPKVTSGSYLVGDLAHYDGHVCCCYRPGTADSADWFSFGSEPPSKRKLHYRSDFEKVVRPPLVAS
jgi:hypothetical protein